ncbi:hypothetical protein [Pseudomonas sp.]|uniref:hypothetical protein n=1 Tax=Pseudomonas sp. TaxID=306 RepID=UPI0028A5B61D|nr:hypothetical protein [Pseudomonas sp.]
MSDLSKQELQNSVRSENLLYGWGAVLAIGRGALDKAMQDAFLKGLGSLTYIEPFSDRFSINQGASQLIEIEGLIIGCPQLSFEHAVATDRIVTVRMPLLAGDYRYLLQLPGEPPRFHRSLSVREGMGYVLEARCRLTVQNDKVSRQLQMVLDLGEATHFTCNLGETDYERTQIGTHLQQWLLSQPEERRILKLAACNLRDYRALTPKSIALMTQPAPWVAEQGHEGEGAAVLFMQLGVDWEPGTLPTAAYPYLLPKDGSAEVALVSQSDLEDLGLGMPQGVLAAITVGSSRQVILEQVSLDRSEDPLSFGALQAGPLTRELVPSISQMTAASKRQFAMVGGSGAIDWTARNLYRPAASGSMTAGQYEARPVQDFVKSTQVVLVSGHAQVDAEQVSASALVVEHDQPLVIAPQTANWSLGDPAIEFVAAGGSAITWSLQGEKLGELNASGNRATFIPDEPAAQAAPIQLQRVRANYNDNGLEHAIEACVVIVNRPASLDVEPFHIPRHASFQPVQFQVPENWRDRVREAGMSPPQVLTLSDYAWTVFGEGTITAEGVYTPPANPTFSASVVRVVLLGRVSGYAIVEHGRSEHARSAVLADWADLDHFYLKALSAPQCFANGMQQILVQVDIQTDQEGSSMPPISDDELQTLKFYTVGGSELKVVEVGIEPPEAGTPGTWVMNRQHNPLLEMRPLQGASSEPLRAAPGQTLWNYYLQTTSTVPVEIYAMFKQSGLGGRWFNSEVVSKDNGKVALQGLVLPTYDPSKDYPWDEQDKRVVEKGTRVDNDTFNYMTLTVDYWKLTHVVDQRRIPFVAIDIDEKDNRSTLRWASDEYEDEMLSYSGFLFGSQSEDGEDDKGKEMIYDGTLVSMASTRKRVLQPLDASRAPAEGELLLSLNRVTDFRLRREQPDDPDVLTDEDEEKRKLLKQPFRFRLLDRQGNRHALQVSYAGAGRDGRNTFLLSKQPARR